MSLGMWSNLGVSFPVLGLIHNSLPKCVQGFPGGSVVKNLPAKAGNTGLIPRSGISPGEAHGNPFQYSCLENPMDRGAWQATLHGVTKSRT